MTRLLFWNIRQTANADVIAQVVASKQADVIALAEARHLDDGPLTESLRMHCHRAFHRAIGTFKVHVYSTLPSDYIRVHSSSMSMVILSLRQVFGPTLLIVFAHLASKMGTNSDGLSLLATRLRSEIEQMEVSVRHSRTIVMGDLNMEPHESGVLSSETLHATMSMSIARSRSRKVHGQRRLFFYNPMWNLLGDQTKGPPGTFYRNRSDPVAQFWHMMDQVLLRPDVIDLVDTQSLTIVTKADGLELARPNGHPNLDYSDHFPIFIETRDKPQESD